MSRAKSYVEFLSDTVASGTIMGVSRGSALADLEMAIGDNGYIDDVDRKGTVLRRDYGLCEFSFSRTESLDWFCTGAMIQSHRLSYDREIPGNIAKIYGEFPTVIVLSELQRGLEGRGIEIHPLDIEGGSYKYYGSNVSSARIIVDEEAGTDSGIIWSVSAWWE